MTRRFETAHGIAEEIRPVSGMLGVSLVNRVPP